MIEETFKIHDRYQFEIKLGYKLSPLRFTDYHVDSYFFIPNNLAINPLTYDRDAFFNDLKVYLRFKTPSHSLGSVANSPGELLPMTKHLESLVKESSSKRRFSEFAAELKIFCCMFRTALRDHVLYLGSNQSPVNQSVLIGQFLDNTRQILEWYRSFRGEFLNPDLSPKAHNDYVFADEYLSLLTEQFAFKILQQKELSQDDRQLIISQISSENTYRKNCHYPSIIKDDSDNEEFIYRCSVFKKYFGSILYLDVKRIKDGYLLEQIVFAIAAGIAMALTTAIAFVSQAVYGNLTMAFFIVLVISYMFKDRIKEICRQAMSNKVKSFLYDYKSKIHYDKDTLVGKCKESFDFVSRRRIPKAILDYRHADHFTEMENGWMGQTCIRYRRSIRLFSRQILNTFQNHEVSGVNDIIRFDVSNLVRKMDNPRKKLQCLNEGEIVTVKSDKSYHVNLVVCFTKPDRSMVYKRFRIVLNRAGIKRLEEVPLP